MANETQVELLLKEVSAIADGKATKEELASKLGELKEAIDKRDVDVDKQLGDIETKMETKMAELIGNINGAFQNVNYGKQTEPEKKYGKTFGEFLSNVNKRAPELKDLAESTGASGGYLVPEEYSSEILRVALENSVVRQSGARIIPMKSNIIKLPAYNMASNASGSLFGGVATYWGKENGSLTEGQPEFKQVKLEGNKLYAYTEDPNELEMDAITNMSGLLSDMFGEALAFEEDYAFINGDGVGKPVGLINAPATVSFSRGTASTIFFDDVVTMVSRFKGNIQRARFFINQSAMPQIHKMIDVNGNYIWNVGGNSTVQTAPAGTLLGIPIVVTEKCPALGTTGDIILADCGFYLVGEREGLRIDQSKDFKFQNDQMAYRAIKRIDGRVWLDTAITPRAGGSTLSPFVVLS